MLLLFSQLVSAAEPAVNSPILNLCAPPLTRVKPSISHVEALLGRAKTISYRDVQNIYDERITDRLITLDYGQSQVKLFEAPSTGLFILAVISAREDSNVFPGSHLVGLRSSELLRIFGKPEVAPNGNYYYPCDEESGASVQFALRDEKVIEVIWAAGIE